jgi:hypothetical protein
MCLYSLKETALIRVSFLGALILPKSKAIFLPSKFYNFRFQVRALIEIIDCPLVSRHIMDYKREFSAMLLLPDFS